LWNYLSTGEAIWSALKKAAKKEVETGIFLLERCVGRMWDQLVKVLVVGVTVEIGLHGLKIIFVGTLCCVDVGSTGEGIGRRSDGGGWAPVIRS
jgi:hypothetical protein